MLKILFDQNFNQRIIRGLSRRVSNFDYTTTQILNKERETDLKLLEFALSENRVILTHDINTFPGFAFEKIIEGENISGVLIVPADMSVGEAINELELIVTCCNEDEFRNRVEYLPILT